jgi:hypothetical protein
MADDHDIRTMTRALFPAFIIALLLLAGGTALAHNPNNLIGGSQFNPPPPPPLPPPSTAVPVVPQMDVQSPHYGNGTYGYNDTPPHTSFHKRVSRCLAEAEAAGFRPGSRRDYFVRSCVNQ